MAHLRPPTTVPRTPTRRAAELRRRIREADQQYYNLGAPDLPVPGLTDAEYDALFRELKDIEEAHPEVAVPDSPTRRVGAPLPKGSQFLQVPHIVPMLSIDSLVTEDQVREFEQRSLRFLGMEEGEGIRWAVEPKFDGVSANLLYEEGVLVRGLSRGDGTRGEDITANLRTIRNLPLEFPGSAPPRMEVRGEVIMSRPGFTAFQQRAETTMETAFRNARNTVAGSLKLLDPATVRRRPLEFIAWGLGHVDGLTASSYREVHDLLATLGFQVAVDFDVVDSIDEVIAFHHDLEERRQEIDYEIDGVVAKVDSIELQNRLGRTARAPRWLLAYKFAPRRGVTVIERIAAQVGRTGAVTPVAHLQPVELAGVTVQRATLHNWGLLEERDVRVGDEVVVERAGDVIPKVVEVHTNKRRKGTRRTKAPQNCPTCDSSLQPEGALLFCVNVDCLDQLRGRIAHMAGRRALDIDRLGPKYVDQLMQGKLITKVEDVFELPDKREAIIALDGWGDRSFEKLSAEVTKARTPTLSRFLISLGIRHVGEQTAKDLAAHFSSLDTLMAADEEALIEVEGVGPEVAKAVRVFFDLPTNKRFLAASRKLGLEVRREAPRAKGEFAGRIFCFTGGLSSLSRDAAKALVEAGGGRTSSSITKKVTDVVVGEKGGAKLDKAKKLGLPLLSEDQFLALIGRGGT